MTMGPVVQSEPADEPRQVVSLLRKGMARRRRLFDHGRVLLGYLVHLIDGLVHLSQGGRLFSRRRRDLADQGIYARNAFDDSMQGVAGLTHQDHAPLNVRG